MRRRVLRFASASLICLGIASLFLPSPLLGAVATLNSGLRLEGLMGLISKLGENPFKESGGDGVHLKQIVLLDDGLRRTFFPTKQLRSHAETVSSHVKIRIPQRVATAGRRIGGVGPIIRVTPFDQWGHRIFTMSTSKGPVNVIQGISEVTPLYCKVEALLSKNTYVWDMRIATSSIPGKKLSEILHQAIDMQNPDARLEIVKLYIQADRYRDARVELEGIQKDFPELDGLDKKIDELRQAGAKLLIKEIELRRDAGRHEYTFKMLNNFPQEGIAGETLIQVREIIGEYVKLKEQRDRVFTLIQTQLDEIKDEKLRKAIEPIQKEIAAELNVHTLNRMVGYLGKADDEASSPDQKLALAISGWLLGSDESIDNMAVALSLFEVRNLARDYLRVKHAHERVAILAKIQGLEGGSPTYLAKIIAAMKPAIETPVPNSSIPGMFELTIPGLTGEPDITYYVQLPSEYNPYRRYPCLVTLNGAGTTPKKQIDWWAGSYSEQLKSRLGQATRQGYVVIAPKWTVENQREYEYTAREHAAVLYSLRDACRRFSIDTDRVFLSGHSMGGDAAWDIAVAHPDLWAGVMPIVAKADKYVTRYWENAKGLPLYFVAGQFDGDKITHNSSDWNRYLTKIGFDAIMVEYKGRGHEHFQGEIQRLFKWMEYQERKFFRRKFTAVSMRSWDNFFWWAEFSGFPSRSNVAPKSWPKSGARPITTTGRILENNGVSLRSGAENSTVWLSPEMIDFGERISINGKTADIQPTIKVILEDVRTRGDRQHPFWAKANLLNDRLK